MKSFVLSACCWAVAAILAGCADTSPIDYQSDPFSAADASPPPDAEAEGSVAALCRDCMTQGACASETAICYSDPKCTVFENCMLDRYCLWYDLTDLAHMPACVAECGAAANLYQNDPAVAKVAPFIVCAHDPARCAPQCGVK